MPVDNVVPLNQTQRISEVPQFANTIVQPQTYYTCPENKKACVHIRAQCTSLGAATRASLIINDGSDNTIMSWSVDPPTTSDPPSYGVNAVKQNTEDFVQGGVGEAIVVLQAGDLIKTSQDSGTNASFRVTLTIQELPV